MAIPKIKSTYSLDEETIRALEATSRRWRVSKSEVLRRAIRAVADGKLVEEENDSLAALDELQDGLGLGSKEALQWHERVSSERRASSTKREEANK